MILITGTSGNVGSEALKQACRGETEHPRRLRIGTHAEGSPCWSANRPDGLHKARDHPCDVGRG
jgi:hypothetical protein